MFALKLKRLFFEILLIRTKCPFFRLIYKNHDETDSVSEQFREKKQI